MMCWEQGLAHILPVFQPHFSIRRPSHPFVVPRAKAEGTAQEAWFLPWASSPPYGPGRAGLRGGTVPCPPPPHAGPAHPRPREPPAGGGEGREEVCSGGEIPAYTGCRR